LNFAPIANGFNNLLNWIFLIVLEVYSFNATFTISTTGKTHQYMTYDGTYIYLLNGTTITKYNTAWVSQGTRTVGAYYGFGGLSAAYNSDYLYVVEIMDDTDVVANYSKNYVRVIDNI